MTELSRVGPEVSEALPVTSRNESWLADALSGSWPEYSKSWFELKFPVRLNSSRAVLVDLPPNVAFLSVLGPRHMTPGAGGECRFVFDPPIKWHAALMINGIDYTYADAGNPTSVGLSFPDRNISFAGSSSATVSTGAGPSQESLVIENVHLWNQQLDPSIQYRFAVLQGSPEVQATLNASSSPSQRPSLGECDFSKIQLWQR